MYTSLKTVFLRLDNMGMRRVSLQRRAKDQLILEARKNNMAVQSN